MLTIIDWTYLAMIHEHDVFRIRVSREAVRHVIHQSIVGGCLCDKEGDQNEICTIGQCLTYLRGDPGPQPSLPRRMRRKVQQEEVPRSLDPLRPVLRRQFAVPLEESRRGRVRLVLRSRNVRVLQYVCWYMAHSMSSAVSPCRRRAV